VRTTIGGTWGVVLVLVVACGRGGGDDGAEARARAEIDSLGREWEEAANRAEVDRLVAIYAPDAVILPPGGPVIEGSETIRELFRQEFERFDTKLAFTTQAIEVEEEVDEGVHSAAKMCRRVNLYRTTDILSRWQLRPKTDLE